jgi:hypothetical protein
MKIALPNIELPHLSMPNIEAPKIERPEIERPQFESPHFERPQFQRPELPQWQAPDFSKWQAPEFEMPRLRRQDTGRGRLMAGIPFVAAIAAAVGALAAYFLDPDRGRSRRAQTRDRLAGMTRRAGERLARTSRYVTATAEGKARALTHSGNGSSEAPNDAVLAHRVESELFRDPTVPKGRLNINAEHGVVYLRGVTDTPDQIRALEDQTRRIDGVRDVRNLLKTAEGTPAKTISA